MFDVDSSMLATLDELEDHPTLYERCSVDVKVHCIDKTNSTATPPCNKDANETQFVIQKCETYLMKNFVDEMKSLEMLDAYDVATHNDYVLPALRKDQLPSAHYVKKKSDKVCD